MRLREFFLWLAFFLWAACANVGFCWEPDVHYGLTKWLAVKAGFTLSDAELLALATQSADEGALYPAPKAVVTYTCLGRDELASQFVQRHHFSSYAKTPGPPGLRKVEPGAVDNGANLWAREEITTNFPDRPPLELLRSFGASLHPLEDSWSHQGPPDIAPAICSKELAWGHPRSRGGWWSHNADLTHLHEKDTLETANAIYNVLVVYRSNHPQFKKGLQIPWNQLVPALEQFAVASTKTDKRKWFMSDPEVPHKSYTRPDILERTSLPESKTNWIHGLYQLAPKLQSLHSALATDRRSLCLTDFVSEFLTRWIVRQDIEGSLEYIDVGSVAKGLATGKGELRAQEDNLWVATVLSMWLMADHGLVNFLGHGIPLPGDENQRNFLILSSAISDRDRFPYRRSETLSQAIRAPATEAPFLISLAPSEDRQTRSGLPTYLLTFQFNHAPHDVLLLSIRGQDHDWQVTSIEWLTD
jgi:hypothetical protein